MPFFTASYYNKDIIAIQPKDLNGTKRFVFVGTLSNGKQPLYAIELIEQLHKNGNDVELSIYGEGNERVSLENYIAKNNLENIGIFKRKSKPRDN